MNLQDEKITNATIPEEPVLQETVPPPPDYAIQGEGGSSAWEEYQRRYDQRRNTMRAAIFGGLAGAVFFFGLAAAILSGHFLPVFLLMLAITSLLGSLSSPKAQAIYAGFQGFVFFLGLAACALTGWWWPGIFVVLGIAAILGIGNGLLTPRR